MTFSFLSSFLQRTKILVLSSSFNEILLQVQSGIISSLENKVKRDCTFEMLNANDDFESFESIINAELANNTYDLIFTIGGSCSSIAKRVADLHRLSTPIVFGGVQNPEQVGIIRSKDYSGNQMTGVYAIPCNTAKRVESLLLARPNVRRVALLYSPCLDQMVYKQNVAPIVADLNIQGILVDLIGVSSPREIYQCLQSVHHDVDALMVPRDTILGSCMHSITDFCNERGILFYSSDDQSVTHGSSCAYADLEYNLGMQMAEHALPVLTEGKKPTTIKSKPINFNGKMMVNKLACVQQGIDYATFAQRLDVSGTAWVLVK